MPCLGLDSIWLGGLHSFSACPFQGGDPSKNGKCHQKAVNPHRRGEVLHKLICDSHAPPRPLFPPPFLLPFFLFLNHLTPAWEPAPGWLSGLSTTRQPWRMRLIEQGISIQVTKKPSFSSGHCGGLFGQTACPSAQNSPRKLPQRTRKVSESVGLVGGGVWAGGGHGVSLDARPPCGDNSPRPRHQNGF
jgi:hypothetical protein